MRFQVSLNQKKLIHKYLLYKTASSPQCAEIHRACVAASVLSVALSPYSAMPGAVSQPTAVDLDRSCPNLITRVYNKYMVLM